MGLELVGGTKAEQTAGQGGGASRLADAERLVAEARQRLGKLADRLAELQGRLGASQGGGGGAEMAGSVPVLEMPSS